MVRVMVRVKVRVRVKVKVRFWESTEEGRRTCIVPRLRGEG